MTEFIDQMNNTIRLSEVPRRIVSLVPSQTELLYTLGLEDRVVGITKFCIHPDKWFQTKKRIGGTKDINIEKVKALKPDLIIGNKEENEKSNIEELASIAPIWMSDIFSLTDSLNMILKIGELVGKYDDSKELVSKIKLRFHDLEVKNQNVLKAEKPSILYLIWRKPYLAAGKNTFIDDMLLKCGFQNFTLENRYPEVNFDLTRSPDIIYLSSEPYPFKEIHIKELQALYPKSIIKLVDGEMFSWYGSRLLEAPDYFYNLHKDKLHF